MRLHQRASGEWPALSVEGWRSTIKSLLPSPGRDRPQQTPLETTVLVVDDEYHVRHVTAMMLQYAGGYSVVEAASGSEALEIAKHRPLDLAVVDVVMPDLTGDQVVTALRRLDPDLKVLYLTGRVDTLFANRGALWESESYLEKPYTRAGLLQAVTLALTGHL